MTTVAVTAQEDSGGPPLRPRKAVHTSGKRTRFDDRVRIVLIDRRPLTLASIAHLLEMNAREFTTLPRSSLAELLNEYPGYGETIGLIVLSIGAAGVGDDWVHEEVSLVKRKLPDVPVVVISDRDEIDHVMEALRRGIRGYIPTTLSLSVAIEALRLVQAGGTFIPASALMNTFGTPDAPRGRQAPSPSEDTGPDGFTRRELEVLALLRQGKPNKIIAYELHMQESTVKVHVRHIMRKLNATNRTQVAFLAHRPSYPGPENARLHEDDNPKPPPDDGADAMNQSWGGRNGSGAKP